MKTNYFSSLIIVILVFIILLALMVFIGLLLIITYSGGASDLGPLGEIVRSGGELAYRALTLLGEWIRNIEQAIGSFIR